MIYIKEIKADSFLHFSPSNEGFRLRDFSQKGREEPVVLKKQAPPEWTAERIRQLASVAGNWLIEVPAKSIEDYEYWHDQTLKLNKQYIKRPIGGPSPGRKWIWEIVIGVVVAVLGAAIVAWLRLGK